ncbi:MAG: helix-turn-helix transcriptional regulator, partial [Bacteroidetes bacterium]|nr:helix-turn-helix transcriptional regulator [Bacteroidota bacterium]
MGRTADYSKETCSVAGALSVVGDPWTMIILRDAFAGVRRFDDWQARLGVARNVLAARLKSLVAFGVMETRLYSERPPRHEYVLTAKGRDLLPVLLTLKAWGDRYVYGD